MAISIEEQKLIANYVLELLVTENIHRRDWQKILQEMVDNVSQNDSLKAKVKNKIIENLLDTRHTIIRKDDITNILREAIKENNRKINQ